MRARAPLALGLGATALVAVAVLTLGSGGEDPRRAATRAGSTATVERQTLVERELVDGTLGYAGNRTVINRLSGSGSGSEPTAADATAADVGAGIVPAVSFTPSESYAAPAYDAERNPHAQSALARTSAPQASGGDDDGSAGGYGGSGTLTALPRPGSVVRRGGALYRLDGDPVVLMYGSTPAYRALQSGLSDGRDVEQLERNLAALGFDPGTVDETFTSDTAAAVGDWQESAGLDRTGSVELGRVVFQPGPRRIGEHKASVGSVLGAGAEVLETSSTRRVVTVELDASMQSLAKPGAGVEVTMPDGAIARGRIADVANVARELESSSTDPNAEAQLVVDVTIHLRSTKGAGRLDEAPVSVGLAQESRRGVLAVPVGALVARSGGGYGVELAEDHRIVPVEAGLFADGYVEVSGPGIREGTRVVVPSE